MDMDKTISLSNRWTEGWTWTKLYPSVLGGGGGGGGGGVNLDAPYKTDLELFWTVVQGKNLPHIRIS